MKTLNSQQRQRRKLHRLIARALTGTALGMGLFTIPALANTYTVTSTANDGSGSLNAAIDLANSDNFSDVIDFSQGSLGYNPDFTLDSSLDSITNPYGVTIDTSAVGTVTINQTITAANSGIVNFASLNADGNAGGRTIFGNRAGGNVDMRVLRFGPIFVEL